MLLAPSILAADLADFKSALRVCESAGADLVHVDVMDGHFVPNLTFGIPVIRDLKRATELPLDVHLMVERPEALLDQYLEAGASWLTVHWEASTHLDRMAARIRHFGAKAGVALNPATPIEVLSDVLPSLDYVVLMSVNPGFAGQPFLPYVVEKARRLKRTIEDRSLHVQISMDGGVDANNIEQVVAAGVDICVAGSAVFGAESPEAAARELRERAEGR